MSDFETPRYVSEGQRVVAPFPSEEAPDRGLWCVVSCAAGDHARGAHSRRGFTRWFHISQLRIATPSTGGEQSPEEETDV